MSVIKCFSHLVLVSLLPSIFGSILNSETFKSRQLLQKFRRFPQNQTVLLGEEVKFICSVTNKNGTLYWIRNGDILASETELEQAHENCCSKYRFEMNEAGTYILAIPNATFADEGEFQCQVRNSDPSSIPITTPGAFLVVNSNFGSPELSYIDSGARRWINDASLIIQEGSTGTLECISAGGKPTPKITWLDTKGRLIPSELSVINETSKASLNITGDRNKQREKYICEVTQTTENDSCQSKPKELNWLTVEITISYPTEVTLQVEENGAGQCGKSCVICAVDKDPALYTEYTVLFLRNGEPFQGQALGDHRYRLCLENITTSDSEIRCVVGTEAGNHYAVMKLTNICPTTTTTTTTDHPINIFGASSATTKNNEKVGQMNAALAATILIASAAFAALIIAVVFYFRRQRKVRGSPILGARR